MNIYPNIYLGNVEEIKIDILRKNNIKALILDIDNTLIDYDKNLAKSKIEWVNSLKAQGIKMYILSNTTKERKVKAVSEAIGVPYKMFARKPSRRGFIKIQKELDITFESIGVVGDQIFTDIIGGNRCKMFTILVDPVGEKDFWYTAWKRPIENKFKNRIKKGEINVF